MGLFDKFHQKNKVQDKTEQRQVNAEPSKDDTPASKTALEILKEKFGIVYSISPERNNEICNRFIIKALAEFEITKALPEDIKELSYNDLCGVYNNIEWFVKMTPLASVKVICEYKAKLREELLSRLRKSPLFSIYCISTNRPLKFSNGYFYIFTNSRLAQLNAADDPAGLTVVRITPETFDRVFASYYCTGYTSVKIDGVAIVSLSDLFPNNDPRKYGKINVDICEQMITYKQTAASYNSSARKNNRELYSWEKEKLSSASWKLANCLLNSELLLPAKSENGSLSEMFVPLVKFADGRKSLGLFTDIFAVSDYYGKPRPTVALPNLIRDQYKNVKNDISGILINPGREEYMLTKDMLDKLIKQI